jgi:hypothetical protein
MRQARLPAPPAIGRVTTLCALALLGCGEGPLGAPASSAAVGAGASGGGADGAGGAETGAAGNGGSAHAGAAGGGGADPPCTVSSDVDAQIAIYRALYDEAYVPYEDDFDAMAASGAGDTYYTFQYVLDAALSVYEATADPTYLARAMAWAQTMMSKATIIDASGYANWKGIWCVPAYFDAPAGEPCPHPEIAYQLEEFQGTTELARLARIVLLDPSSTPEQVALAAEVRAFVAKHIVEKWGPKGRSSIDNLIANAADASSPLSDKTVLLGRILLDLQLVAEALGPLAGEQDYSEWLTAIAQSFTSRLVTYHPDGAQSCPSDGVCSDAAGDGCGTQPATPPPAAPEALTWDVGVGWYNCQALDTSHANRYPYFASELLHAEYVVQPAQITGLARLLSRVLYNGNSEDPRIRNFIDGSQCAFYSSGPDRVGLIYSGWATLAEWDDEAFAVVDAVSSALVAGKCNPTLAYNGTVYGRMALPAHLAKAARLRACPR